MPFLLMVFLTLVCLPEPKDWLVLAIVGPEVSVVLTILAMSLPVLYSARLSRSVAATLDREPGDRSLLSRRYERGRFRHQLLLFGMYLLSLFVLGWGNAVQHLWQRDGHLFPGAELVILSPMLIALGLSWCFYFEADRAAFRAAHRFLGLDPLTYALLEPDQAAELPVPPRQEFGSRAAYVALQARQKLALVLIPISLLLVQKELQRQWPTIWEDWQGLVNGACLALVAVVFALMPWIIRIVLGLRPLPPGPMRDRLMNASRRLQFRASDILVWNTNGCMANAMVVGILPWLRYVVFTDRLLEEFQPAEVEAVLGHEVGHIKHHHMFCYVAFLVGSMTALGTLVTDYLPEMVVALSSNLSGQLPTWRDSLASLSAIKFLHWIPLVGCLFAYILFVFGFLSRRCERQADIFGCRAVSCGAADCSGHDASTNLADAGRGLCPAGIRIFIRALEKVAVVNGISRDKPGFLQSWQHSTIGKRVQFLQGMLSDSAVEPRFQRRVALLKWGLFLVLGGVLLAMWRSNGWSV